MTEGADMRDVHAAIVNVSDAHAAMHDTAYAAAVAEIDRLAAEREQAATAAQLTAEAR